MNRHIQITLLKGGTSAEREVSLNTGRMVAEALRSRGHQVTEVDVEGPDFPIAPGTDLIYICLHGTFGEDGQLQRILRRRNIPFTGSDEATCRLAFDKDESKKVFLRHGIPTPPSQSVGSAGEVTLELPVVVKPPCQGSSVGITRVFEKDQLAPAIQEALKYGPTVLVEKFIEGRELTIGVLEGVALPVVEIRPKEGFYDYTNKYTSGKTEYLCPAPLTEEETATVQDIAVQAHTALGCRVYSRVDILLDKKSAIPYVLEVNTIPGMTATSLLPKAAQAAGIDFPRLCEKIALLSLAEQPLANE